MILAHRLDHNPFATATPAQRRSFNIHTGSQDWWDALITENPATLLPAFLEKWKKEARVFQQQSKPYWLY